MQIPELDIAEVAARSGLAASTLRYYEAQGLISPVGRHGLRRQYSVNVLERLALINLGRRAGFRLSDIAAMLTTERGPSINRKRLAERASEISLKIQQLTATRDLLNHVAECPHANHMDCAKFQQLLRIAGKPVS